MNQEKMKEFADEFEKTILATIKGVDEKGIERLKILVEEKRKIVKKRRSKAKK